MEKRRLGRTELNVSCIGFGGIVVMNVTPEEARNYVAEAVDRGVNYFDVAPTYGNAQDRLGPALEPYRQKVFLACKTQERTKDRAKTELHESLEKLRTDYFDVYQFHALDDPKDIETVFGPGGAMEAVLEAKEKGLIRYIGFTTHSQAAALTLMDKFDFDTVLFPFNWVYWLKANQGPEVVEKAQKTDKGIMALKALAHRKWQDDEERTYPTCWYKPIFDDQRLAELAVRFTLSQPVSVAMSPGDIRMLRLAMDIADEFEPLSDAELQELQARADREEPLFDFRS